MRRSRSRLPRTARDIIRFKPWQWFVYTGVISLARLTGAWRYPIRADGDAETMGLKDKIYWVYKAQDPVTEPQRGSALDRYFEQNAAPSCLLPSGFTASTDITLSAAGDLMNHPFLPHSAGTLYEEVDDLLFGADISIANLECVIDPSATDPFLMRGVTAPPLCFGREHFAAVKGTDTRQFTIVSTANNHTLDAGESGAHSTIASLRREGISFHGINEQPDDAGKATLVERGGIVVGFISHTFGLNGKRPPDGKPWIVNRTRLNDPVAHVDFGLIARQIDDCRTHGADLVVAVLHWGMEHEYYPRTDQIDVAHHLAEMGIDLIIGHHPHVIQPWEVYRTRRDPARLVPVFYSLGNLITPFSDPRFRKSAVARLELTKGADRAGAQRTYIRHASLVPVFLQIDEEREQLRLTQA